MRLTIDAGLLHVWTADHQVHLIIRPRRGKEDECTFLQLRAEPMPLVEMRPEDNSSEVPADQWIWSGTPGDATRIVDLVVEQLTKALQPTPRISKASREWRVRVLESLGRHKANVIPFRTSAQKASGE